MNPGILNFSRFPNGSSVLTSLEPSLRSMLAHVDEYIKTYHRPEEGKPELPYFYNERANIGLLAGGVWRSEPGNLVFEGYGEPVNLHPNFGSWLTARLRNMMKAIAGVIQSMDDETLFCTYYTKD